MNLRKWLLSYLTKIWVSELIIDIHLVLVFRVGGEPLYSESRALLLSKSKNFQSRSYRKGGLLGGLTWEHSFIALNSEELRSWLQSRFPTLCLSWRWPEWLLSSQRYFQNNFLRGEHCGTVREKLLFVLLVSHIGVLVRVWLNPATVLRKAANMAQMLGYLQRSRLLDVGWLRPGCCGRLGWEVNQQIVNLYLSFCLKKERKIESMNKWENKYRNLSKNMMEGLML